MLHEEERMTKRPDKFFFFRFGTAVHNEDYTAYLRMKHVLLIALRKHYLFNVNSLCLNLPNPLDNLTMLY
jgi:hypothetical protein